MGLRSGVLARWLVRPKQLSKCVKDLLALAAADRGFDKRHQHRQCPARFGQMSHQVHETIMTWGKIAIKLSPAASG